MDRSHSVYPTSVDGHPGCFHFLTSVNNAAVKTHGGAGVHTCLLSSGYSDTLGHAVTSTLLIQRTENSLCEGSAEIQGQPWHEPSTAEQELRAGAL